MHQANIETCRIMEEDDVIQTKSFQLKKKLRKNELLK